MSCNRCVNESIEFYVTWCVHYKRIWTIYSILHIMYDYNPQMAHNWYMYTIFRCCYNSRRRWCDANCFSSFFSFSGVLDFFFKIDFDPNICYRFPQKLFTLSHKHTGCVFLSIVVVSVDVLFCQCYLSHIIFAHSIWHLHYNFYTYSHTRTTTLFLVVSRWTTKQYIANVGVGIAISIVAYLLRNFPMYT